jgi:hypothetical protein
MGTRNLPDEITTKARRTALSLPGTAGHYASTPAPASMAARTGDIDVRWVGALDDWVKGTQEVVLSHWLGTGNQRDFALVMASGYIFLYHSPDGTTQYLTRQSTVVVPFADGEVGGIRATLDVDNGATGHTFTFYTSSDDGVTWDALGSPVVVAGVTTTYGASTTYLSIGGLNSAASYPIAGTVHHAEVYEAGTLVANPDFTRGTIGKDGIGNIWTINGASSGYVDSDGNAQPILDTEAIAPRTGLYLPGVSGEYVSAPYVAAMDITNDIDIRWVGSLDDWTPSALQILLARDQNASTKVCWMLGVAASGVLTLYHAPTGAGASRIGKSSAALGFTDGATRGVRACLDVDNGAGGYTITFYTSTDLGATWDQLGAPVVTAGVTSIYNSSTAIMEVGSYIGGANSPLAGTVLSAEVRDGIDGTLVASPDFTNAMGPRYRDAQENIWTINGSAWAWELS